MVSSRNVYIVTTISLLTALLFQFQNCAPMSYEQVDENSSEVRIIEDWNKAEIQFVSEHIQIHDEAPSAEMSGLCHRGRNGSSLKWSVLNGDELGRSVLSGVSECHSGQFKFQLAELENVVCGVKHMMVLEGDWGASAFTYLERRCQPLMSEPVEASLDSPPGTNCQMEYHPVLADERSCIKVCYREEKLVFEEPLNQDQCSGLAAKLAGP